MRIFIAFLWVCCAAVGFGQCPEITSTTTSPPCIPDCDRCGGDKITINVQGGDLPHNGKIDYYADINPGFNPYAGQGVKIGSANIITNNPKCRICPQLLGFMIDACGTEAANEFLIMWSGSGMNTSDFNFDFAAQNNTGGAGNADIGAGGCSIGAGPAGLVGGCNAVSVGANFNIPANSIWIVFTSSNASTNYDFSAICGLSCKIYVSASTCTRTIGAYSNFDASPGNRTQVMTITGCACSTVASYDIPGTLTGNGDFWEGGNISNAGCAVPSLSPPAYTPANSIIDPFMYTIPQNWCDKDYEIVGIPNPVPDPDCCMPIYTERITVHVKCPQANNASIEACETANGQALFNLEDADPTVLGVSGGTVEYYRDMAGTQRIFSPYLSGNATIYARISDGNCKSNLVQVQLKVHLLPIAKATGDRQCDDGSGFAIFDLTKLENTIKNGNFGATVKFFLDNNKTQEIQSPFQTISITIFACIHDGVCESKPVAIQLTVNPKPMGYETSAKACPKADGSADFNLNALIPKITKNQSGLTVKFYEDDLLIRQVGSPYKTKGDTLFAVVSDGTCFSDPVMIILELVDLNTVLLLSDRACDDGMGNASFNLIGASRYLQQGDTSIHVSWYSDSLLMDTLYPPVIIQGLDTIYALLQKDSCVSMPIPMILEAIQRPTAQGVEIYLCADSSGMVQYDLNQLIDTINRRSGKSVIFARDSLLSMVIGRDYQGSGDTLYAVTLDGNCNSNPVKVIIHVSPTPAFTFPNDEVVCHEYVLPAFSGKNLSNQAAYLQSTGAPLQAGDTIRQSQTIYLVDQNGNCATRDSFRIDIIRQPNAGGDHQTSVCEGSSVNLNKILGGGDFGGQFVDVDLSGSLMDSIFQTAGLADKTFQFYYIVNGNSYCPPDTSVLQVKVVRQLNPGIADTVFLCAGLLTDLSLALKQADPGGQFKDPLKTGALVNGQWDSQVSGPGNFKVFYVIGDGVTCPMDSTAIEIRVKPIVELTMPGNQQVCNYFILPTIAGKNVSSQAAYYTGSMGSGVKYQAGDTIFSNLVLYIFDAPVLFCSDEVSFSIQIVQDIQTNITQTGLCSGDSLVVGSSVFSQFNPSGMVLFPNASTGGCDSIVHVSLSFLPAADTVYQIAICSTKSIQIHQQIFNTSKPTGTITLPNASVHGCDSTLQIKLFFTAPSPTQVIRNTICMGDTVYLHGKAYHPSHLASIDTLVSTDPLGCDSIVDIQFTLLPTPVYNYSTTLCDGDSLLIGNEIFNKNRPTLKDTLKGMAANGCDSVRNIQINYFPVSNFIYRDTLCQQEFVFINGQRYDENRTTGQEKLIGASEHGCDSIVFIELEFQQSKSETLELSLCENDSIQLNGHYYSKSNPQGSDTLKGQAAGGCDSILLVRLQFRPTAQGSLDTVICENHSVVINGMMYDIVNPAGTELLPNASSTGCDSLLSIKLRFLPISRVHYQDTLCENEELILGGQTFNLKRPDGNLVLQAQNGCDSILMVDLSFAKLMVQHPQEITIAPGVGKSIQLLPNFNPFTILWSPANGLSCTNCLNPQISSNQDTKYQVTLTDSNGCSITLQIQVLVFADDKVYVPNTFSPNGDNINDRFKLFSENGLILIQRFEIFDRWGNEIFHESNTLLQESKGWDGNALNGDKMNPGVYIYSIQVNIPGVGERILYGDVTLVR